MFTLQTLTWTWSALLAFGLGIHAAPHTTPPTENSTQPLVHLRNSTIGGVYNQQYRQEHFLSIPYAEPPIAIADFAARALPSLGMESIPPSRMDQHVLATHLD